MHPFGGTPKCPRCQKAVYLAEQVIGPGRKLYHKPCLACTTCNKRLDSLSLLEHNEEPYCKSCHVKNFGTRDLRQANHPYRARSPSLSLGKTSNGQPQRSFFPPPSPTHPPPFATGNGYLPQSQANKSISPATSSLPHNDETVFVGISNNLDEECEEGRDSAESLTRKTVESPFKSSYRNPTGLSQIVGDDDTAAVAAIDKFRSTVGRSGAMRPITQTPTGTRYGVALGGPVAHITGSPRKWGGETPNCPKCGKSVYFAEQVKAVGKTYHKGCLRCSECSTSLDSNKLRDHEGVPLCSRCYNKLHGPQGNGYALLGKAGG
ncbi:uncharacterized protein C8R40DRAFT_845531 [Lentinula edodes]|uniref:uncharacterized protein n=1 Tax=Lentinula edodes TaxID=5353 RepID=UPI001E8ED840|nr:uncharacterized protein C8R40DRAFT_845531 [Lentinula edodes]KAH7868305.1 hypothetical protein C8R40DRAFT_845531 [Lentinula edodes]